MGIRIVEATFYIEKYRITLYIWLGFPPFILYVVQFKTCSKSFAMKDITGDLGIRNIGGVISSDTANLYSCP